MYYAEDVNGKPGKFYESEGDCSYIDCYEHSGCNKKCTIDVAYDYLVPGKKIHLKVKVTNNSEEVVRETNTVTVRTKMVKPYIEGYTDINTGKIRLEIDRGEVCVEGYDCSNYAIYRSTTKNGTYTKIATVKKETYLDPKGIAGKKYFYKVKAVCVEDASANSKFSNIISAKKAKYDKKLANAFKNTKKTKIASLENTLSLVSKLGLKNLTEFDGGFEACDDGKIAFAKVFDSSKIKNAGAILKKDDLIYPTPYQAGMVVHVQKNGINYKPFVIQSLCANTVKVKKGSTEKQKIAKIKSVVNKYYPTSKYTVTVEKYSKNKSKYSAKIKNSYDEYNMWCISSTSYGKYKSNQYYLKIKNKTKGSVSGWTFVTVLPTL